MGCLLVAAAPKPAAPHWPHGDPNAVVKKILAEPAYRSAPTTSTEPKKTLLEEILNWLNEKLGGVFAAFFRALRGAKSAGTAFGIGLIIALLALLVLAVARIVTFFIYRPAKTDDSTLAADAVLSRSSGEWIALARESARRGEYATAIAALFNAALRRLDERGIVAFDGSRSPGEYRALVRGAAAPASSAFDNVARRFVVASFSRSPSGAEEYEETLAAYDDLEARMT